MRLALILSCIFAVACQPVVYEPSGDDTRDYPTERHGGDVERAHSTRAHGNDRSSEDRPRHDRSTDNDYRRDDRDVHDMRVTSSSAHPGIVVSEDDIARLKQLVQDDPVAHKWFIGLHERAERLIDEPEQARPKGAGGMLAVSRTCLVRIPTWAGMYRLTGDDRFAKRATQEMLTVCRFPDWQPSDFLATAEMTNAVAIGYDWCYNAMSPDERSIVRDALVEKGLRAGLEYYQGDKGWTTARHNWNPVCNGGMIVGALALQEEESRLSKSILTQARESIKIGMSCFAPDGGWEEGPTYWNYATRYATLALAALRTKTGSDWNLSRAPGFANTGM